MLKIGTSKMGSVVDCPRCHQSVVVPPFSAPQAEQLYQQLKNKQPQTHAEQETPIPPVAEDTLSEPTLPESALDELGGNIDDADLDRWIDELWTTNPKNQPESSQEQLPNPFPLPIPSTDDIALLALQKRFKLTVMLLYVSSTVTFFLGLVFGFYTYDRFAPSPPLRHLAGSVAEANEVTGTLYFFNKNGERQPDVDAVIICLPKDRQPSPLLPCQGLLPEEPVNNDTAQMIHEMGGKYGRTDATGSFTFQHQEGIRYFVMMISAHQKHPSGGMKPSVLQNLQYYFRDPERLEKNCFRIDEYEWSNGKHSLRHTFDYEE